MMKVYLAADNIITSLGFDTTSNFEAMLQGIIGIQEIHNDWNRDTSLFASQVGDIQLNIELKNWGVPDLYTRFEKLLILSILKAQHQTNIDLSSAETLFIISSTKGNVELLDPLYPYVFSADRVFLWKSAQLVTQFFNNPNVPLIFSNACISGVSALVMAERYIRRGLFKQVVICGADVLSRFIVTGFHSLKAVSPTFCKPYDVKHEGLNLGEGAATMILSSEWQDGVQQIEIKNGTITNDANHISGPSRTGEGLYLALRSLMGTRPPETFAFINTHGTATVFNDDMESIALHRANLSDLPVSSLKGYIGHTMGAAGVIESVITAHSLRKKTAPKTAGFSALGTPMPIHVLKDSLAITKSTALKTASGFGGCNAVIEIAITE